MRKMGLQQVRLRFKHVLRQAQHERNINALRQYPFVLSLSKGSCCEDSICFVLQGMRRQKMKAGFTLRGNPAFLMGKIRQDNSVFFDPVAHLALGQAKLPCGPGLNPSVPPQGRDHLFFFHIF